MAPANPKPCAKCPWRLANQGKRHPHGFYSKTNLRRLWAGLRRGERMTCHPTDPAMAEFEGYEETAGRARTHECAGALILQQREVHYFQEACAAAEAAGEERGGLRRYRRERPKGLMRDGLMMVVGMFTFRLPGELEMARPNLNEPAVGYEPLGEWEQVKPGG
jgi:hypothetical protein